MHHLLFPIQEISLPLLSLVIVAVIKSAFPAHIYDAIPGFPRYSLEEHGWFYPNDSIPLGFAPNTTKTTAIVEAAAEKLNITASPSVSMKYLVSEGWNQG